MEHEFTYMELLFLDVLNERRLEEIEAFHAQYAYLPSQNDDVAATYLSIRAKLRALQEALVGADVALKTERAGRRSDPSPRSEPVQDGRPRRVAEDDF